MNLSESQATANQPVAMQPPESIMTQTTPDKDPSARFRGEGTTFRAKIIGVDDVPESRGDKMCQDSILKLKAIVKASGQHKQKIVINISLNGIKIINLMNAQILHEHRVDRISFIARDLTDRRAFGYIFGIAEGKHKFFAIKTAKPAEHVVLALRDLFQVVYDMKKKEVEVAKQQVEETPAEAVYAVPNNRPVQPPAENLIQERGENITALQKELDNIHKMSDMDAFKNPWPENTPTSPDTPGVANESDMFGMANLSDISSLSSDFSLASASSSAPDSSRALDGKNRLKDGRSGQPEHFHRTSSGKSAVSWNGTTQQRASGRKKRHGSLTATHMKELAKPVSESAPQNEQSRDSSPVNRLHESTESAPSQKNNFPTKPLQTQVDRSNSMKSTDSKATEENASNVQTSKDVNTFFNDVMAATGLTTQIAPAVSSPDDNTSSVKKVSDTMDSVSRSDSLSSVSSSTSNKASTPHKSMSISNLFFSKSDKNKSSLKRKHKFLSRQSSGSSVVSATDKVAVNPTNTLSKGKSNTSLEKTASITSLNSAHSCRKSSSSSVTSSERAPNTKLAKGFSVTSLSSQPDTTKYESPTAHERIRPTAAVARPRPRAALSRKVSNVDSKNPPMFKTKDRLASDSEDESKSGQKDALPRSADNTLAESTTTTSAKDHGTKEPSHSWACFNDDNRNESAKPCADEEAPTSWQAFPDGGLENLKESEDSEAWNAFTKNGVSGEPISEQSALKTFDAAHPFSNFAQDPFHQDPFSNLPNDPFQSDPFSADTVVQATFDHCDPFEEITLDNQQEDPFQNYEAVFHNISLSVSSDKTEVATSLSDENKTQSNSSPTRTITPSKEIVCANDESNSTDKLEHSSSSSNASSSRPVSPSPSPYLAATEAPSSSEIQDAEVDHFQVSWEQDKPVQNLDLLSSLSCPSPLNTDKSDEEVTTIQSVSKPPPIPPRPPVRDTLPNDVLETLPPAMPPPPLPARIDVNTGSSNDQNGLSPLAELHTMPPNCKPPDLPSEITHPQVDLTSTNSKHNENDSYLSDNEERLVFPPNSDPPELPSREDTVSPFMSFLPPSTQPPQIPARNKSCSGPVRQSSITDDLSMSDTDVTDEDQLQSSSEKNDYSNDLAALSMNTAEPAVDGGNRLTKDQILSGFGQGGMYQQQQQQQANFFPGQQQSPFVQQQQQQQQQPTYSVPQRRAPPAPANPFAGSFGGAPQAQTTTGMFPPGPSPVIPARPGAMNPPTAAPAQSGAAQNPFGDAFGGGGSASDGLLAPVNNSQSGLINGSAKENTNASDPFASLVPGMGSGSTNTKDMFKDFQIAKPPQPPPRSNDSASANFDNYFRTAVGGVPLDEPNNEPIGQKAAQNPPAQSTTDPFSMFGSNDTDQSFNFGGQQQSSNVQSLFG